MSNNELLPHLFRTEYQNIISVLVRHFGFEHISVAEDITSDVFLIAAETWGLKGVPDNPSAWLHRVAKNRALDMIRRKAVFKKISPLIGTMEKDFPETDIDLSDQNIRDSQLQMMFVLADPMISVGSRIALILRLLCGFGVEEIASAFFTSEEVIQKRIFRAKDKLRQARISLSLPDSDSMSSRVDAVLASLYLVFNEGYYSSTGDSLLKKDLCYEAMRLNLLLIENEQTNRPAAEALFALMCFHVSRFEARTGDQGEIIRLEEQDASLWELDLIIKGNYYLNLASRGDEVTVYHLEAAIAFWHTTRDQENKKWENILHLYNQLLIEKYIPVIALNRTFALAKIKGNLAAIDEAKQLGLSGHHLYHALLGYLYTGVDDCQATQELNTALKLAKTENEKNLIRTDLEKIQARLQSSTDIRDHPGSFSDSV